MYEAPDSWWWWLPSAWGCGALACASLAAWVTLKTSTAERSRGRKASRWLAVAVLAAMSIAASCAAFHSAVFVYYATHPPAPVDG